MGNHVDSGHRARPALALVVLAASVCFSSQCQPETCRSEDPSCDPLSSLLVARSLQCSYRTSWNRIGTTEGNPDGLVGITFSTVIEDSDGVLYAAGEASDGADLAVVMRSDNGGAFWTTEWTHRPTVNTVAITSLLKAPDGSLIAVGTHNPDGTNSEVFLARKPSGGSFSVVSSYERQDGNVSRPLNAGMSPGGTVYAVGNAAVPADISGMLLSSGGDYTSLSPRTLFADAPNSVVFSALSAESDAQIILGGFVDLGASQDFMVGFSNSDGSYTSLVRDTMPCCVGDPELHDPADIYRLSNGNIILGLSPGGALPDLRPAVIEVQPDGQYFRTDVIAEPGAATMLKIHGTSQVVSQFLPAGATGTAQVSIRREGQTDFTVSFPANTDGLILNDSADESIRLLETHMMPNGDLLLPVPVHNTLVASEPTWIYRLSCRQ